METDAIVVGAGFYGLRIALHLRTSVGMGRVVVYEREGAVMQRASRFNQARVHGGYHYPRSLRTAYRSRVNAERFVAEYGSAISDDFTHYYAVARHSSKVSPQRFELFCDRIGAFWRPAGPEVARLFDATRVERVYRVREPTFDAQELRRLVLEQVARVGGIEVRLQDEVRRVEQDRDGRVRVEADSGSCCAREVISTTYARTNLLLRQSGLPQVALQHELSELTAVETPPEFWRMGVTVIDGPFFSLLPTSRRRHSLTHVRYTPHRRWVEGEGVDPGDRARTSSPRVGTSAFAKMRADVARYVPALRSMEHRGSHLEVKTTSSQHEMDDARPILQHRARDLPRFRSIVGSKLDNIYDVLLQIEGDDASQ